MIAYPRRFDRQFAIARRGRTPLLPGGERQALSELDVVVTREMPLVRVHDRQGRLIGGFLGHPVDCRGQRVLTGEAKLDLDLAAATAEQVEKMVYDHAGSFIFVLDSALGRRVYLDADGSLSAVYDADSLVCAATAGVLLDEDQYRSRFRRELYEFLHIRRDGWFPAGLTAHQGVSRLMCNFYLDLDDGRVHRHWPRELPSDKGVDPDEACTIITRRVAETIQALRTAGPIATTLTAGNETRLILAACRSFASEMQFYTVDSPDTRLDAARAGELARRWDLNHRLIPAKYASPEESEQWHARAGHCVGGPNMRSFPTVVPLGDYAFQTGGLGGEIGRAFFWRPTDTATTQFDARAIATRFGMPMHDEVVRAVDEWLLTVPECDAFLKLDLAYLELRMSCWAFAQAYSTPGSRAIHPLISRESFTAMLSLPPEWRRGNKMILRGIELCWPELLELPINRYGDFRDQARAISRAIRRPYLLAKKLRKTLG